MQGIELVRQWYQQHLLPALESEMPETLGHCAIGIAGRGSECFGYDDDISRDHDFQAAACVWLTAQADSEFGFKLTRLFNKVCKESGADSSAKSSALGDSERHVMVIDDFLLRHLGYASVPNTWQQWLYTPEYAFAECVNGEIFHDGPRVFSEIRATLRHGMPEDVRIKKLAARAVMMAQSGQYNYSRCLKHKEPGAAAMALNEFVKNAVSMVFLLNFSFAPYYKWMFRAMRELPVLGSLGRDLENLFSADNKEQLIEKISSFIIAELKNQGLSELDDDYLEPHGFAMMSKIKSREIRTLHIMEG